MRKVTYSNGLSSYFYVEQIQERLMIVSIGSDNPLEFIGILDKTIQNYTQNINKNEVEIYFDLLSCVGNNENRYLKLIYNKNDKNAFFNKINIIEINGFPSEVILKLKMFYENHLNEALLYSILSNNEKNKLLSSPIV